MAFLFFYFPLLLYPGQKIGFIGNSLSSKWHILIKISATCENFDKCSYENAVFMSFTKMAVTALIIVHVYPDFT